jgi:hypothetical protein
MATFAGARFNVQGTDKGPHRWCWDLRCSAECESLAGPDRTTTLQTHLWHNCGKRLHIPFLSYAVDLVLGHLNH